MDILRLYHTVRYLKPVQFYYRAYYKIRAICRRLVGRKPSFQCYAQGHRLEPVVEWIEKPVSWIGENKFCFLNVQDEFCGAWDSRSNGDLWRYNLNYMDFLLQPSMTAEDGFSWIERYIVSIPDNSIVCDPYPISLRGMNWIKFVSKHYDELSNEQIKRLDTALYSQYRILLESTEKHLMANHYLENGFSLLFASYYFNDRDFFKAAEKILYSQLKEQILSDGAHYELSPMYHCIILERLLDCYNIIDKHKNDDLFHFVHNKAVAMLGWLATAVMDDANIPLLNDSATGIAPLPDELFAYAESLGIEWSATPLGESGYRKLSGDGYDVFADVAALGPSYNLGHSHADTFTFVMNVSGKQFIVDTGTSTYTAGARRDYERSTKAHNTVTVAGLNSSRVWGGFRCAQRATVNILDEGDGYVRASHNGYSSQSVALLRTFTAKKDSFVIIDEVLCGKFAPELVATFHLAPDVSIISADEKSVVTSLGTLSFDGAVSVITEPVEVACSYNILQPTMRILVSFNEKLTTEILPQNNE